MSSGLLGRLAGSRTFRLPGTATARSFTHAPYRAAFSWSTYCCSTGAGSIWSTRDRCAVNRCALIGSQMHLSRARHHGTSGVTRFGVEAWDEARLPGGRGAAREGHDVRVDVLELRVV